jgi:mannose-6-phosphate isomerase
MTEIREYLRYPLRLAPLFQPYLWGGRRLAEQLGKPLPADGVWAESWEIVDHGTRCSVVAEGPLAGWSLHDCLEADRLGVLGRHHQHPHFPLLLKYLDCHQTLSVQVHPDDAYAAAMSPPDLGKTEAWYIVSAEPESVIYAGLRPGVDRVQLEAALEQGDLVPCLNRLSVAPGECIFIPAGTVHALGGGLLVAEIQQASDTTFRLYDWDRVGTDGQPRPLHVEQALQVIDFGAAPIEPTAPQPSDVEGAQQLVGCSKFRLDLIDQPGEYLLPMADESWIVTVPQGQVCITTGDQQTWLGVGQSCLLCAACQGAQLRVTQGSRLLLARGGTVSSDGPE